MIVLLGVSSQACEQPAPESAAQASQHETTALALQSAQVPLPGASIPQFVQPLPRLSVQPNGTIATVLGNQALTVRMCEFWANVLPPNTLAPNAQPKTRVWGYIAGDACPPNGPNDPALDTYVGPVMVNARGTPTDVTWVNALGNAADTQVLAYRNSTDQTLHWADPLNGGANLCAETGGIPAFLSTCAQNYAGPIPAVVHLHGGEVPPEIDGNPDAWFTASGLAGPAFYSSAGAPLGSARYRYPNRQEAAPIWFHDHALGLTRLNVYAGLAGAYYLEDPALIPVGQATTNGTPGTCTAGCLPANLQPLADVIPLVIQDRMFDTNGQLYFPADSSGGVVASPNPEHPYWVPEFVGDTIVVNGKAWPYLNLEAKRYRFLLINGSLARTYQLYLPGGPAFYAISGGGGYLDAPVPLTQLTLEPGQRYELVADFSRFSGKSLVLLNRAKTPFPKGAAPRGATEARILQFRVGAAPAVVDTSYDPATGAPLRSGPNAVRRLVAPATGTLLTTAQKTRALTLNEVMGQARTVVDPVTGVLTAYPGGPLEVLLNNTRFMASPRPDAQSVSFNGHTTSFTEAPQEGDTEVWEIINLTADAHPIHLHLVQFQLLNRQAFQLGKYLGTYQGTFGGAQAPAPLPSGCGAGVFCPEYGPPLGYAPSLASGGKYGGNPDVAPFLEGPIKPPGAYEAAWLDTVIAYPGEVTRLAVRWAPTDLPVTATPDASLYYPFDPSGGGGLGYVWHCHIIDHEDNEMMRPDFVTLNPLAPAAGARSLQMGIQY